MLLSPLIYDLAFTLLFKNFYGLKLYRAASMTLRTVFLSLQALLCAPEPDDPQDAVVAKQFVSQPELFKKTARNWAQAYAGASGQIESDFRDKIRQLKDMGVDEVCLENDFIKKKFRNFSFFLFFSA